MHINSLLEMMPCQVKYNNDSEAAENFIRKNTAIVRDKLNGLIQKELGTEKYQSKRAMAIRDFYKQMREHGVEIGRLAEVLMELCLNLSEVVRLDDPVLTKAVLPLHCDWVPRGYEKHVMEKFDLPHLKILLQCESNAHPIMQICLEYVVDKIPQYQHFEEGRKFFEGLFNWEIVNESNLVCLENALIKADIEAVEIFLTYNYHKIVKEKCGKDLLACLFGNSNSDIIKLLPKENIDMDGRGCCNYTPIHYAAFHGVLSNVQYFLQRGTDLQVSNDYCTPLYSCLINIIACITRGDLKKLNSLEQCFKLLLQNSGNLFLTDIATISRIYRDVFGRYCRFKKFCKDTVNLLTAYLAIYDALGYETVPFKLELMDEELQRLYYCCREQLELLKSHVIFETRINKENTKITMLTILAEDPKTITSYVKETHHQTILAFMNICEDNINQYYRLILEEHIKMIKELSKCRCAAARLISDFSKIFNPNHLVIQHIVTYLTFKELLLFQ